MVELIVLLSRHPNIGMMILNWIGERIAGPDWRWALNIYSWSGRDLYRLMPAEA